MKKSSGQNMDTTLITNVMITGLLKPAMILLMIAALWFFLRNTSAALQHFVLSLGVVSVLVLPLLTSVLPIIEWKLLPTFSAMITFPWLGLENTYGWLNINFEQRDFFILLGVYLVVATSMLFYLLLGIIGLAQQTKATPLVASVELLKQLDELCELLDISRKVTLVSSREVASPQTWGLWRPVIMLPREALLWDQDKQLSVLIHELGHIARWDWLTTMAVKITCACFWFLVPLWWFARQIYHQAEIACDDYIYKLRDKHLIYARNLMDIAESGSARNEINSALSIRGYSPIYLRIMAVLDKQRAHQPVAVETAQYWLICGLFCLFVLASVQLMPLQQQLPARDGERLVIELSDAQHSDQSDTLVPRVEVFSWELLQQLKPHQPIQPVHLPMDDKVETLRIQVPRPTPDELQDLAKIDDETNFLISANTIKPNISVEGFLPIDMVIPDYPALALQKGIEGWVQVQFTINAHGQIIQPHIIARSPSRVFDRSVLAALKKSHYRPQLLNGEQVIVQGVTELFRFKLTSASGQNNSIDQRRR
jgi:bla regulator protein BlaR1